MILVHSSPKFSKLFSAVGTIRSTSHHLFSPYNIQQISDAPITPWFPIRPHHTIHLSGFALSPRPGGNAPVHSSLGLWAAHCPCSAMVPSTLPAKRRQEQPVRSPRPADQLWQTIVLAPVPKPCFPILPTDTFPLLSPSAEVLKSPSSKHSTREPQSSSGTGTIMAGESAETTNGGCPVTFESWSMCNPSQATVPATDQNGDLCARSPVKFLPIEDLRPCRRPSTWPNVFPPGLPMPTTEFPEWIKEIKPRKPPMMQFRPTSGSCQGVEPIAITHVLPPHPQLDIRSPAGQNIIQKLEQQSHTYPRPRPTPPQPPPPQGRKRKKVESGEPSTPTEPRRLRRLYEACARCRSKKIKVRIGHNIIIPPQDRSHVVATPSWANFRLTHSEYPSQFIF